MLGMVWRAACCIATAALGVAPATVPQQAMFTETQVARIQAYWNEPGRLVTREPNQAATSGPWQVRLTPEGSLWLWTYDRARGLGKTPPNQPPPVLTPEQRVWETWIDAKVAYDRYIAACDAAASNSLALGREIAPPALVPEPGPMPEGLAALCAKPTSFAELVKPTEYVVRFDDGHTVAFVDNATMRPRYQYYRFPHGVMSGGTAVSRMPPAALKALCAKAGITDRQFRIMRAVSLLEGGFESVNTYDTGFVSIGFLQFAALTEGGGSLGQVLLTMKRATPSAFEAHFRRFGLDVTADGKLVALDVLSGTEFRGPDASQVIIRDKRLTAVFQRAGARCEEFKIAQLRVARDRYYPENDVISVASGSGSITVRVGDVVRSEAGIATLMDRKVNTGKLDPLPQLLAGLVAERGPSAIRNTADFERDLVAALVYRKNYLLESGLSQPRLVIDTAARKGAPRPTKPKR